MRNYSAIALSAALVIQQQSAQASAAGEHSKTLTDSQTDLSLSEWKITSSDWAKQTGQSWSVQLRTLHGGRQEGVQVIDVDNGIMKFTVIPTRGFEIWKATVGKIRFGWDSPVSEIVHPAFVNLADNGGQGWLSGFGGWLVRGGLASFGAPAQDGDTALTLHGHVDYIPASYVSVRYESRPVPRLVLRGIVDDAQMFGPQLRLTTEISTVIGKPQITLDDSITNLSDAPQEMESLYHINFGPPLLGPGAEFIAPVKHVAPMNARSAQGNLNDWTSYQGPHGPGYTAQVFLMQLWADQTGRTAALLRSADGSEAALLRFNTRQLPYMSLWKNEVSSKAGYVTGLEPATGFPYSRNVERAHGRVPKLRGGQVYHINLEISALTTKPQVSEAINAIASLQTSKPQIQQTPLVEP